MSTTGGMPPLPQSQDVGAPPVAVQPTMKERLLGGFGQLAARKSGQNYEDTMIGRQIQAHQTQRLADAQRHYQNATLYASVLGGGQIDPNTGQPTGTNPSTGEPLTPQERQKYMALYQGALGDYQKSAGVSKEAKQTIQQQGGILNILATKGHAAVRAIGDAIKAQKGQQPQVQGQGQPQGVGMPQPPAGGGAAPSTAASGAPATPSPGMPPPPSGATPSGPSAGAAAGQPASMPAPPPPPLAAPQALAYDAMAQLNAPHLAAQQAAREEDDRKFAELKREKELESGLKIEEEQAKPSTAANKPVEANFTDDKGNIFWGVVDKEGRVHRDSLDGEVVQGAARATNVAPDKSAYAQWQKNPDLYKEFLKESAAMKTQSAKNPGVAQVYAIYRMMEMAYKDNPNLLPVIGQLAPQIFKAAGMQVPPAMAASIGQVPTDQPLSPETGQPIGTSMPGAPTAGTRNQAQTAARVITELPRVRQEVNDLAGYLGPLEGRKNVAFLLGKVGSTGDPQKDQALNKLRTDMEFLSSAASRFHLNAVKAMEKFETVANSGKDSSEALNGFLDSLQEWAGTAQKQERGFGEGGGKAFPSPPSSQRKVGDTVMYKGKQHTIQSIDSKTGKYTLSP